MGALEVLPTLSDREKAAFLFGTVAAWGQCGWPEGCPESDQNGWMRLAGHAHQMLSGGVFNPLDAWRVISAANKLLSKQ